MTLATDHSTAVRVCTISDLEVERGGAVLLGSDQIALFRLPDDTVYAVSNFDPFSRAHVISRGIVGTRGDIPTIASPMYKQVFDLRTGECLDSQGRQPLHLTVWPVQRDGDDVALRAPETHPHQEEH